MQDSVPFEVSGIYRGFWKESPVDKEGLPYSLKDGKFILLGPPHTSFFI